MRDREALVEKLEAQLKEWSHRLEELRARAGKAAADRRAEYRKHVDELQERRDHFRERLHELRNAGEHVWEEMREGTEKAWEEMHAAFESARTRLGMQGKGGRTVADLMTPDVAACHSGDFLNRVATILWERDCGCVPVVDADQRVIGMITDRDVCIAAYTQNRPLSEIGVVDVMSGDVAVCHPEDPAETVEAVMRSRQVRRLPVTEHGGRLLGIVGLNDLIRAGERDLHSRARKRLKPDDIVSTLAAIGEPRAPRHTSATG